MVGGRLGYRLGAYFESYKKIQTTIYVGRILSQPAI